MGHFLDTSALAIQGWAIRARSTWPGRMARRLAPGTQLGLLQQEAAGQTLGPLDLDIVDIFNAKQEQVKS